MNTAKRLKPITVISLLGACLAAPLTLLSADAKPEVEQKKPRPYPLEICIVSDEQLDEHGAMKPFAFPYRGQEFKICCKSCKPEFDKEPAKFVTKLAKAEKEKAEKEKAEKEKQL